MGLQTAAVALRVRRELTESSKPGRPSYCEWNGGDAGGRDSLVNAAL